MTESTYRVLQHEPLVARSRLDVEERDRLHVIAKGDFCRYYHKIHQHTIIDIYTAARAHDSKLRHGPRSNQGNNNKHFSNGGGPRFSA